MAGEAILANIVTEILKKVGSFALEEINLARGVKKELEKLKKTVVMIEAVIRDAETKQVKEMSVGIWLKDLKDLAYEADDILDAYAYDLMHQPQGLNRKRDQVRSFFSRSSKMGHEIKDLNQKFKELATQRVELGLQVVNVGSSSHTMGVDHGINHRETYALVDESKVLGREVDKSKIIKILLANNSSCNKNDKISVIPIVGMGGLGKTTLAQLVYKDNVVENHFDLKIWVCVSDVFVVQKLFIKIIESLPGDKIDALSNLNVIAEKLQERLAGKRFLLVLDDVWNENASEWNKLKVPLVVGAAEGSKILVTTRSENVASIVQVGDFSSYKLQTLGDDICLSIFEQRAFGPSCKAIKTQTLVDIGKQLVRKCDGLPLALEALGSLMHSMKEVREWEAIRDSEIWDNIPENQNKILPALKLSYDHLLPQVKPCFSYCSMFPKDSEMKRKTLIRLWVAEGFIQPSKGDTRLMEEIGNGYFNNLLWNSFFQVVKTNEDDGEIKKFKMHDLIHDLAQSVAGTHECSIMEASEMPDISEFRRLNLLNVTAANATATATVVSKGNKLRTLFLQGGRRIANYDALLNNNNRRERRIANYDRLFNNNNRLRVLDLSWSNIEELPASIGDLKHLRYLDLSWCYNLKKLPDSITRLYNLQTLNLEGCRKLEEFPKDLNKLIKLRHLLHDKRDWELKVGQLTCLETLSGFRVPEEDNGGGGGVGQLQPLDLLGGKLKITGLKREIGANAEKANLKAKKYIKELKLIFGEDDDDEVREDEEYTNHSLVLEGLQPHPNLRVLEIEGFMGLKFPTWMNNNLQNLVHLTLLGCNRCKQLPALPSSLRCLEIGGMELLEEFGSSSYPSLEKIHISHCPKLKSMPTNFFSLKEFRVDGISNGMGLVISSIVRSNLNTLTKLYIKKVDGLEFLPPNLILKGNNVLESLEISYCSDFKGFNNREEEGDEDLLLLSSSSSLHTLWLENCRNLTLLPGNLRGLTSLRKLVVKNCESVEICPILKNMLTGFPSMELLSLEKTSGLVFLPLGLLKGNNVLKTLKVHDCPDFQGFIQEEEEGGEDLSVVLNSNNSSLRSLELIDCPVLRLLPDLKDLTSLLYVRIEGCNEDLVISLPNGVATKARS